jgi:hypothetical protein
MANDFSTSTSQKIELDKIRMNSKLTQADIPNLIAMFRDALYPVGCIYITTIATNPQDLFGGTWVAWGTGRVPVGIDAAQTEFNTVEKTGGEKTHTLSIPETPAHAHGVKTNSANGVETSTDNSARAGWNGFVWESKSGYGTTSTGGGGAHNNLQPYITCYMWKRTA